MRSTKMSAEKKVQTKRRLYADLLSAAKPVKGNKNQKRSLGNDDADDAGDDAYGGYGFDLSSYSLKYAGCSAIATYSDEQADDEDAESIFTTDQYVVFRFCPSDSCRNNSTYGCLDDYGEYMVPIASWLNIMADYRAAEFESYCDYCAACGANYYNGRKLEENDDAAGDDAAGDDGNANDDGAYDCSYASECSGYTDVCNDDDDAALDYTNFFECVQLDITDDFTLYVGPHCASDKTTIVLGAYSDQYCSKYTGNKYDLATITGLAISTDSLLEYYNTECIPCKEGDLPMNKGNADYQDSDDVSEICENLYGYAAKCNRHIGGVSSKSYQSYQQEDNEYAVCSFIASVITGTYDEYGYIYVDPLEFESDNKYNEYAENAIRQGVVTVDQVFGLMFFILAVFGMVGYAALLHVQIQRKTTFDAAKQEALNKGINRQNSGIMMARSTTADSGGYQAPQNHGQLA